MLYTHHYTYWIYDRLRHKGYIGVRTCHTEYAEDDPYMGSSNYLNIQMNRYGSHNFTKYILKIHQDRESAIAHEMSLHNKYEVDISDRFYNISRQMSTGFSVQGKKYTEEEKERMRDMRLERARIQNRVDTAYEIPPLICCRQGVVVYKNKDEIPALICRQDL